MNIVVKQPSLAIISKGVISQTRFPIHRIYCIGRNYREHAIEMGHNPDREPPFFFQKAADTIVCTSSSSIAEVPYPPMTKSLHYEAELIVAIGKEAFQLNQLESATDCIFGYSIGSDLTRRDLQNEAKKLKRPWSTSKSFDHSAPSGPIVMKQEVEDDELLPWNANISLSVNGTLKQESSIDKMIWSIPEMICHLSNYFRLKPGDLIMTGTPAGVDDLNIGDEVVVECGNLPPCRFTIGQKERVSQTL